MALEQQGSRQSDDTLRNSTIRWLELASIVYAWTDRRESAEDRSWWKTAGARLYLPFAKPQREESTASGAAATSLVPRSANDALASALQ